MEKDFLDWTAVKNKLHNNGAVVEFSEGQVWWAAIGRNIGVEINGKNEDYSRPVIIFKKLCNLCFLAIPLTSQPHSGTWYVHFNFQGRDQYAVLSQIRLMSVFRLYNRMGKLSAGDYDKIQAGFEKLIQ